MITTIYSKKILAKKVIYLLLLMIFFSFHHNHYAYAFIEDSHESFIEYIKNYSDITKKVLASDEDYEVQILFTNIKRKDNNITLAPYEYKVDENEYFYPASSIKLSTAMLSLEKMFPYGGSTSEDILKLGKNSSYQRSSSGNLRNYIKSMLVVSNNNSYNRLYEFLGQEEYNKSLQRLGFPHTQITHRFMERNGQIYSFKENRVCNSSQIYRNHKLILDEKEKQSELFPEGIPGEKIIKHKRDFTYKNKTSLEDLQNMMKLIMFYPHMKNKTSFNITDDDLQFLKKCLKGDSRVKHKFFVCGGKELLPSNISIYNKIGNAYGYLIDNAYIIDKDTNKEFFLTAVIYTGGKSPNYNYNNIGMPFLRDLGKAVIEFNNTL